MQNKHRIVIVGGGAGGLELVTRLAHDYRLTAQCEIYLIEQKTTHIWKPLFHELAAGTLDAAHSATHYAAHARQHGYHYYQAVLTGIDTQHKCIQIDPIQFDTAQTSSDQTSQAQTKPTQTSTAQANHTQVRQPNATAFTSAQTASTQATPTQIAYDTLILALGSTSHDFGIAGVREHSYAIDQQQQAQQLSKILSAKQHDIPRIAIVGAGATGVELAAQIKRVQAAAPIYLIEAAERLLPGYSPKMSRYAQQKLLHIGVQPYVAHAVASLDAHRLNFKDGSHLAYDICIWTAGIQAPSLFAKLHQFERDSINRIKVNASLQSLSHSDVFAIGDCAHCMTSGSNQPLGARAQVASQQAEFLHKAMRARLEGKRLPQFKFLDKGSLIDLTANSAVGELFAKVPVQGALAKSMYLSLYPMHLGHIHRFSKAGLMSVKHTSQQLVPWLKSYVDGT